MRALRLRYLVAGALALAASTASAAAGGWGHGYGYGAGYNCPCEPAASLATVATTSYQPVTTYTARTVYQARTVYTPRTVYSPTTSYVPTVSYRTVRVPVQQYYVVNQGPMYTPAVTGYQHARYVYDEPRRHRYVGGGYRVRHAHPGWRAHRHHVRHHYRAHRAHRALPPVGFK